jgi:TolA-binding protein
MGRLAEAKKLFEQVASTREWRGESTAYSVYSLGQIEQKQNKFAEAHAYYQRVYVAYQKFLPWVAKSYIQAAECLQKLGKTEDAVKTLQEMLRNQSLSTFPEYQEARTRLNALGQG